MTDALVKRRKLRHSQTAEKTAQEGRDLDAMSKKEGMLKITSQPREN